MDLADYNITFIHIKGSNNILACPISRLKMLDIYKHPTEDPKKLQVNDIQQVTWANVSKMHTWDGNVPCAEQKWDINF